MPPKRNTRTASSKKDGDVQVQIQFCHETGESYRPFTDPKRIETNDKKKGSNCDSRAHVPGVPGHLLGIMDSDTSPITDKDKSRQNVQIRRSSASRPDSASPIYPVDQQLVFATDKPAQEADEINPYSPSDVLCPSMYGVPSPTTELHLEIPQVNAKQNEYDLFLGDPQGSYSHSPFHNPCASAYQGSPHSDLPGVPVESLEASDVQLLPGTFHFPALDGEWSDGTLPGPAIHFPFDTSSSSPSSQSDMDSPMSPYLSSSMDTLHQGHYPYTFSDGRHALFSGQFTFGDKEYMPNLYLDYMTGSDYNGHPSPVVASSTSTDDMVDSVIAETQEMAGKMRFNPADLACLDGGDNYPNLAFPDQNTMLSPCFDPGLGQGGFS